MIKPDEINCELGYMAHLENVIIINDHGHINGGQAKVAIDTALMLSNMGYNIHYFCGTGPIDKNLSNSDVKVTCLEQKSILDEPNRIKASARGIWNFSAASKLKTLLSKYDPNNSLIHWHGYAKTLSASIAPVITNSKIPHVYTMHEYFISCPNGGFFDYNSNTICTKTPLSLSCIKTNCDVRHPAHKAWRVLRQLASKHIGKLPKKLKNIIYISNTSYNAVREYLPHSVNLYYVQNPYSLPRSLNVLPSKKQYFVFVGRLNPEKGGKLFAQAARQAGVKALFVGDGPEREAILEANPDAIITGWQPSEKLDEWYGQAICLVLPSLWYETFGLVAYEALARGIPVICGTWNAASECIEPNINGILVDNTSVASWSDAITKIQRDISAYKNVEKSVKQQNYIDNLIAVYNNVRETN